MSATTCELPAHQIAMIEAEAKEKGVLRQYRRMVKKGESPRMALMLCVRAFPGVNGTDAKFNKLERERVAGDDMESIAKIARRAGINTSGRTYNGALGSYDDPHAWVSSTHDVRQAAKKKGLSLRGQVNVENQPKKRGKPKPLSDRLLNETAEDYIKKDPALAERVRKSPKARADLKERIVEAHAPMSKKKGS